MTNTARLKPKLNIKESRCMVATFGKVLVIQQLPKFMLNRFGLKTLAKGPGNNT
jgi:hypothetical protein